MWTARGAGCGTLPGAHERGSAADAMVGPVPAWHREKKTAPPKKKTKKTDRGRDRAEQGAVLVLHGRGGGGRLRLVIRYGLT